MYADMYPTLCVCIDNHAQILQKNMHTKTDHIFKPIM